MFCTYCGGELNEQDLEEPVHDEDDNVMCSDCYDEKYYFECCVCREYGLKEDQHKMVVIFNEDLAEPGLYKVLDKCYWASSILGDAMVFPHALEWIGEIPEKACSDGYQMGHLCAECQKAVQL